MKRLKFISRLVALYVALVAIVACREDIRPEPEPTPVEPLMVSISIMAEEETRTELDMSASRVVWSAEDRLMVIENNDHYAESSAATLLDGGKAQFGVEFERDTTSEVFAYDAIYPAQNVSFDEGVYNELVKVILPAEQHPTAESFDPMADILVAKHQEFDRQPEQLSMRFKRLVAMGALSLQNIAEDELVSEVSITAVSARDNQPPLAGCNLVNCVEGELFEYGYEDASSTITLHYDTPVTTTTSLLFMCNPMELIEGEHLTVRVVTDRATYTRSLTIDDGRTLRFVEGDLNTFAIDMSEAKVEPHQLCFTKASAVKDGGIYLLAAEGYIATPITSNYGYIQVVEGDVDADGIILQESLDNAYTLEAVSEGYAIKQCADDRYLYMKGSYDSFNLSSSATDGYVWSIEAESGGTFKIENVLKSKFIQYSTQHTSYGCYSSMKSYGVMPTLYELTSYVAPPAKVPAPVLTELYASWDGEVASCGCVVENPEYITDGMVYFLFESDDAPNVERSYEVGSTETYAYLYDVELQADERYTVTAWCRSAEGEIVESESVALTTSTSGGGAASEVWLELPAQRTDGKYPKAQEYKVMSGGERNYTHYYDVETYTTLWVAYPIESRHMGSLGRPGSWSFNPLIDEADQVNLCSRSYSDSYSRGHLIPNAARNGIKEMQLQTFYVTNSVPQIQNSFNGGIWMNLEAAIQDIGESETVYVVTGVLFEKMGETRSISYTTAKDDTKQVPVPNYFYKVVLKVNTNSSGAVTSASTIGFWFDHKRYTDSYTNYAVSVDQIEQWTGFDYFVNLPDDIEASAERNTSWSTFSAF